MHLQLGGHESGGRLVGTRYLNELRVKRGSGNTWRVGCICHWKNRTKMSAPVCRTQRVEVWKCETAQQRPTRLRVPQQACDSTSVVGISNGTGLQQGLALRFPKNRGVA